MQGTNLIPFVRSVSRPLLAFEKNIFRTPTHPLYTRLHGAVTWDEDERPQLTALVVDIDALPAYETFLGVEETVSSEALLRILYYCSDPSRPLPEPVDEEACCSLARFYCRVDKRKWRVPVRYERDPFGIWGSKDGLAASVPIPSVRNTVMLASGYIDLTLKDAQLVVIHTLAHMCQLHCPGLHRLLHERAAVFAELAPFCQDDESPPQMARSLITGTAAALVDAPLIYGQILEEMHALRELLTTANPQLVERLRDHAESDEIPKRVLQIIRLVVQHHLQHQVLRHCMTVRRSSFVWFLNTISWIPPADRDLLPQIIAEAHAYVEETCGTAYSAVRWELAVPPTAVIGPVLEETHPLWQSNEFRLFDVDEPEENHESEQVEYARERTYEEFKEWFENKKDHFYVLARSKYGRARRNKNGRLLRVDWFSTAGLTDTYKFVGYMQQKKVDKQSGLPVMELKQGVPRWMHDPHHRWYVDAQQYPPPLVCPPNHFNLWTESPYHDSVLRPGQDDPPDILQALEDFKGLMRVVCGDPIAEPEQPSAEFQYLWWWIADMIQRPGVKPGVVPVLCGSEGCGKSLFGLIICKLMGEGRYLDTNMENIVGNFNSLIEGRIFVLINEYNKALNSTQACAFKALITDREVTINEKHAVQRESSSRHRFMITTNDHNVVPSSRRPWYIRSTLELKRREDDMLNRLWRIVDNPKALAAIYRMFRDTDILASFGADTIHPPNSALNREFRRSANPYIAFAFYLVNTVWRGEIAATLSGSELHQHWKQYCEAQHMTDTKTCMDVSHGVVLTPSWPPGCISEAFQDGRVLKRTYNVCMMRQELEKGI